MLDNEPNGANGATDDINPLTGRPRRRAASRPAGPPPDVVAQEAVAEAPVAPKRTRKKAVASAEAVPAVAAPAEDAPAEETRKPAKRTRKKATTSAATAAESASGEADEPTDLPADAAPVGSRTRRRRKAAEAPVADAAAQTADETDETDEPTSGEAVDAGGSTATPGGATAVLFQAPVEAPAPARRRRKAAAVEVETPDGDEDESAVVDADTEADADTDAVGDGEADEVEPRRRRRRGGRGRRGRGPRADETEGDEGNEAGSTEPSADVAEGESDGGDDSDGEGDEDGSGSSRRRRRRRRRGAGSDGAEGVDDPPNTVTKVREPRKRAARGRDDEVASLRGSTRIEAKKQRRREGRDAGRRRPPVLTESEFLARRESVERVMVVRQVAERTQIAVLEDGVLVEHHVSSEASAASMVGNVYLGRVQNVLPSMEAAFVDLGRGRNAVLYAGEVNWDAAGLEGQPKRIEHALKSGDPVLVQVTKDPVGQKGARLTSQISLPGRYLVYVPEGSMNGISRKLPDTERTRLKAILKKVVPDQAGVIVRTAAEGASEDELTRDVERLTAQWDEIDGKVKSGSTSAPTLLYGEPDLATKVVRDIFNEDFAKLVVSGAGAWETIEGYVGQVAPDLAARLEKWVGDQDVFAHFRIDEQLLKALDRKVYLPSGGSLVIDRTEAMTVVDVNTGKFTGQGGNLEETVTRNNLEAAEETVRQLRLRDVGGIIVIDFIDMVLESNRDLVTRRLLECLGRDRTKHQVAEVTSLGLVQMTRKRVGGGLLEVFSEPCECCNGRGLKVSLDVPTKAKSDKGGAAAKAAKIASAGKRGADAGDDASVADAGAESSPTDESGEQPADQPADQPSEQPSAVPAPRAKKAARKRTKKAPAAPAPADESSVEAGDSAATSEPAAPRRRSRARSAAAPAATDEGAAGVD